MRLREDGFAEIEKSPIEDTVNVTLVECDEDPLVPLTVIV